jgi:hypothetical protein
VALVDGRYIQTELTGAKDREMWTTLVLVRDPKGWEIAAIRNMLPAARVPSGEARKGTTR